MAENRLSRELETREKTTRKRAWNRPELLPNPTPEPGYTYHWVRVSTRGVSDPTNVSSKLREGWEPVMAAAHPELKLMTSDDARFKDNVVVGGLMLCKAPVELVEERNEHYKQVADSQMRSVDNNFMQQSDPRMPLFSERKSNVTFGKR